MDIASPFPLTLVDSGKKGEHVKSSAALQHVDRPVTSLYDEYPAGITDDWHCHERSQVVYATKGVMSVTTETGSYVIPPQRALWIPAHMQHTATSRTAVTLKTLYVDVGSRQNLPDQCRVFTVSELLKALINQAVQFPTLYDTDSREGRIMQLILDEIEAMPVDPLSIPMPTDRRLAKICQQFLTDPSLNQSIDEWSEQAGVSRRTFTRLFKQQTQITFATWCQQVRLLEAISRLSTGTPITTVSYDVGYSSTSAFTSVFHKTFGVPPSKYFSS
ncbi:helix-turn-helix transcriptional regulator [Alteromonas sp. NFXS44]|uniref:AraC family transcriptional regulator n=1 Tax=Alteromonas sp. NFXS44 TaxID=2818435 RepID=UPI0026A6C9D6|nr:helix-turn-helix transcriptional regulator [Pseudomonadota bacterium]